jgi:uncharacterized protein (UPF0147 family)
MFEEVINLIQQVADDRTESINVLKDEKEAVAVRINTVISSMDEISNDPNIPTYTRTQVWNIVSIMESMQK